MRFPTHPFPSRRLVLTGLAAVALLLSPPVFAQTERSPSEQYLSLRRAYPPPIGVTLAAIGASPEKYKGVTIELTGRLNGIAGNRDDESESMLIFTPENNAGSLTLAMSQMPTWVQSGSRLRVLAVATGAPVVGTPDLRVVAIASAYDIDAAELRWKRDAETRAARDRQILAAQNAAGAAIATPAQGRRASGGGAVASFAPSGLSAAARQAFPAYCGYIRKCNRRLSEGEVAAIAQSILLYSERYQVDPRLVVALIIAESDFIPKTTSNKGAMGLGQLMPDEVHDLGLTNPYDPTQNIAGAIYLLRGRLDKYSRGSDLTMRHIILALASYNAGMGAVKKYGGVPPYRETQNYVKKIERIYRELCGMGKAA